MYIYIYIYIYDSIVTGPSNEYIFGLTHSETFLMWHALPRENDESEEIAHFRNPRAGLAQLGIPVRIWCS